MCAVVCVDTTVGYQPEGNGNLWQNLNGDVLDGGFEAEKLFGNVSVGIGFDFGASGILTVAPDPVAGFAHGVTGGAAVGPLGLSGAIGAPGSKEALGAAEWIGDFYPISSYGVASGADAGFHYYAGSTVFMDDLIP